MLIARNVANVYREPTSDSELISQGVFGSRLDIDREVDNYYHVTMVDRYTGWIRSDHCASSWLLSNSSLALVKRPIVDVHQYPTDKSPLLTKLTLGTTVCFGEGSPVEGWSEIHLASQLGYCRNDVLCSLPNIDFQANFLTIIDQAKKLIGTPYLWGGTTPFGLDCSGFVQLAYKMGNITLLRDARLQFNDRRFYRLPDAQTLSSAALLSGDLLMFKKNFDGPITHVALATGDDLFLHASGGNGVQIDRCDHPYYSSTYAGAVRLLAHTDHSIDSS